MWTYCINYTYTLSYGYKCDYIVIPMCDSILFYSPSFIILGKQPCIVMLSGWSFLAGWHFFSYGERTGASYRYTFFFFKNIHRVDRAFLLHSAWGKRAQSNGVFYHWSKTSKVSFFFCTCIAFEVLGHSVIQRDYYIFFYF